MFYHFRLYDADNSGTINLTEISAIMETMSQVEGRSNILEQDESGGLRSVAQRAEDIFGKLDTDNDCVLTMNEFVQGYLKLNAPATEAGKGATAASSGATGRSRSGFRKNARRSGIKY